MSGRGVRPLRTRSPRQSHQSQPPRRSGCGERDRTTRRGVAAQVEVDDLDVARGGAQDDRGGGVVIGRRRPPRRRRRRRSGTRARGAQQGLGGPAPAASRSRRTSDPKRSDRIRKALPAAPPSDSVGRPAAAASGSAFRASTSPESAESGSGGRQRPRPRWPPARRRCRQCRWAGPGRCRNPTTSTAAAATSRLAAVRRRRAARSMTGARRASWARRGARSALRSAQHLVEPGRDGRRASARCGGHRRGGAGCARRRRRRAGSRASSGSWPWSSVIAVPPLGGRAGVGAGGRRLRAAAGGPRGWSPVGTDRPSGWFPSAGSAAVGSRSPSSSASRARPRKQRDFTVPSAHPSICATSWTG